MPGALSAAIGVKLGVLFGSENQPVVGGGKPEHAFHCAHMTCVCPTEGWSQTRLGQPPVDAAMRGHAPSELTATSFPSNNVSPP